MLLILSRSLYKSVHLVHTKPIPPAPQYFSQRGLPISPRAPDLKPLQTLPLNLTPPTALTTLESLPNTRYPSRDFVPKEHKTVKATRKYLRTSIRKLWGICNSITSLHVEDAIDRLEQTRKKPAEWVKNVVKAGIRSAINIKGMQEDRLYVKEVILGKNVGIKGIRYHAKGRSGHMLRPKTQITVVIEEKSVEDFYKTIMIGKFSPGIAGVLRTMIMANDMNLEDIRKIQGYLTAKGRQQQKVMFKRKVEMFLKEKLDNGVILDKEYAQEIVLKEEAKGFVENYWKLKRDEAEKSIAERQETFIRNQKGR